MLPPPKVVDLCQKVEVTSVNWKSQDASTIASVALVSYKWHGIMYAMEFRTAIQSHFVLGVGTLLKGCLSGICPWKNGM